MLTKERNYEWKCLPKKEIMSKRKNGTLADGIWKLLSGGGKVLSWQMAVEEKGKKASKAQKMELIIKVAGRAVAASLLLLMVCSAHSPLHLLQPWARWLGQLKPEKWKSEDENCGVKLENHDMIEVRFNLQNWRRLAAFKNKVEMDKIKSIVEHPRKTAMTWWNSNVIW